MSEVVEFFKKNLGFIIGLIIGIIFIVTGITYVAVNIAVLVGFGMLGSYVQKNKEKVKDNLKTWIDKL